MILIDHFAKTVCCDMAVDKEADGGVCCQRICQNGVLYPGAERRAGATKGQLPEDRQVTAASYRGVRRKIQSRRSAVARASAEQAVSTAAWRAPLLRMRSIVLSNTYLTPYELR